MKSKSKIDEAKIYSKETILNANKTVTDTVNHWLQSHNFTKRDWLQKRFDPIIGYLQRKLPVGNTIQSLDRKFGSIDTYLSYLIYNLKQTPVWNESIKEDASVDTLYSKGVEPGKWPFGYCGSEVSVAPADMDTFVVYLKSYTLELKEATCKCVTEGNFNGNDVTLGKPSYGDTTQYKIFMRNPDNGQTVKVNFGKTKK